jgi:hypothetical protein
VTAEARFLQLLAVVFMATTAVWSLAPTAGLGVLYIVFVVEFLGLSVLAPGLNARARQALNRVSQVLLPVLGAVVVWKTAEIVLSGR